MIDAFFQMLQLKFPTALKSIGLYRRLIIRVLKYASIMLAVMFVAIHYASNHSQFQRPPKVCIAMIDDRFTFEDQIVADFTSMHELKDSLIQRKKKLNFVQLSMYINKAYSIRHGYKLLLSNMTEFKYFLKENPNKHPVWLKPNFIENSMNVHPECEWLSFMDSDAYFWMDNHETSLNDFFSTATLDDGTLRYDEFEYEKRINHGYYPWADQKFILMIGLNGIYKNEIVGWPAPVHSYDKDYSCAGVFFVKNNDEGKMMMNEWIYGPRNATADQLATFNHFGFNWAREQSVLNRLIIPLYAKDVAFLSFRDFAFIDGHGIQHIWSEFENEREGRMQRVLRELELLPHGHLE